MNTYLGMNEPTCH